MKKHFESELENKYYKAISILNFCITIHSFYWIFFFVSFWFISPNHLAFVGWVVGLFTMILAFVSSRIKPFEFKETEIGKKLSEEYDGRIVMLVLCIGVTACMFSVLDSWCEMAYNTVSGFVPLVFW